MTFFSLVSEFLQDTLGVSLPAFAPELVLCATIVCMLLARMPKAGRRLNAAYIALPGTLIALWLTAPWLHLRAPAELLRGEVAAAQTAENGALLLRVPEHGIRGRIAARLHGPAFNGAVELQYVDDGQLQVLGVEGEDLSAEDLVGASYEQVTDARLGSELFTGMLVYDRLTVYFRAVLLLFAVLFLIFTQLSGIPDTEDSPDFYSLMLGGILGMCLMASANHLLMVFLAVEMASVPSYALAGFLKGRRVGSEAALKYAVYGAGAAGIMLYGVSLLAGALGTCHLPSMAAALAALSPAEFGDLQTVLLLGGLLTGVGLAFKLSAVPFHFWAPDVFEGAAAEVGAFLSVASKAGALALLIRVGLGLTAPAAPGPETTYQAAGDRVQLVALRQDAEEPAVDPEAAAGEVVVIDESNDAPVPAGEAPAEPTEGDASPVPEEPAGDAAAQDAAVPGAAAQDAAKPDAAGPLSSARRFVVGLIALLAAITCTFGNLAAYTQTNVKRLLAYSTIAHAGYMMMPVAAAVQLQATRPDLAAEAVAAVAGYVGVYLFMNLGAFAIVAFLRNAMRSEQIADYAGLIRRAPGVAICFSLLLVSLVGLPPLGGFWPKARALLALISGDLVWLAVVAAVNTALSLFYYVRVVKVMCLDPEPDGRLPFELPLVSPQGVYVAVVTAPVVILGVAWRVLDRLALAAVSGLWS